MNFEKFKQIINDNKKDMTYIYIYYILTVEEELKADIVNDEQKMKFLILLIENTYLYGEKRFDLAFVCGVASDYVDEIFNENMDAEELDNLCDETFLNMTHEIDNEEW
jgi:hypothetical protein